jgi:hypothetical protein
MMEPAEDWYRCDAADEDFFNSLLVLLCHKISRPGGTRTTGRRQD